MLRSLLAGQACQPGGLAGGPKRDPKAAQGCLAEEAGQVIAPVGSDGHKAAARRVARDRARGPVGDAAYHLGTAQPERALGCEGVVGDL